MCSSRLLEGDRRVKGSLRGVVKGSGLVSF
jgi:hypothetical protein